MIRFEPPNEKQRWDSPLFRIYNKPSDDDPYLQSEILSSNIEIPQIVAETTAPKKSSWKPKSKIVTKVTVDENHTTPTSTTTTEIISSQSESNNQINDAINALSISGSVTTNIHEVDPEFLNQAMANNDVLDKILAYLLCATIANPNISTISVPKASTDLLYQLDLTTQKIVNQIFQHQKDSISSTSNPIIFKEYGRFLLLHRFISQQELTRHSRQFVKANGTGTILAQLQLQATQAYTAESQSQSNLTKQQQSKRKSKGQIPQEQTTNNNDDEETNITNTTINENETLSSESIAISIENDPSPIISYTSSYLDAQIGALFIDFLSSQL